MKKGRSVYAFNIQCEPKIIEELVQSYIRANQFELQQKNDEQFYRAGDAMVQGYRYFNYSISGQTLTIYAWFKGAFGEVPLEQSSLNVMAISYRNSLNTLFQEINNINNRGVTMNNNMNNNMNFDPNTGQPLNQNNYQQPTQNNTNQFIQTFQNETTKKQEKMCEVGFWLSLFGLLCAFFGVSYGVIIYILNFYFASQGLKTRKRGKAIATIVLSILSIIITVLQLI